MTSELILTTLAGIGGATVIVAGLGAWLGKVWSGRIAEREKHLHAKEIELLKVQVELEKKQASRNDDAQFSLYTTVWKHLQTVKYQGDRLWEQASRDHMESFLMALHNARVAMDEGRLILTAKHYKQLEKLIVQFENYYVGKAKLIELRAPNVRNAVFSEYSERDITQQIQQNAFHRDEYKTLLDEIAAAFKKQLNIGA